MFRGVDFFDGDDVTRKIEAGLDLSFKSLSYRPHELHQVTHIGNPASDAGVSVHRLSAVSANLF